ncbi:MAG: hypothetical protein OEY85_11240, partial [Rhodospirillales bacterium]|nr:hypothetical protein [Rhodospirillales bacterium]
MEIYRRLCRSLPLAAVAAGAVLSISPPVMAQSGGDDVLIDLSVLEGDREAGMGAPLPGLSGRRLQMPGSRMPQSQLLVPTVEGKAFAAPKLKKPNIPAATAAVEPMQETAAVEPAPVTDPVEPAPVTAPAEPAPVTAAVEPAPPMPSEPSKPEPSVTAAAPEPEAVPAPTPAVPEPPKSEPVAEEKAKPVELKKAEPAPPPPPPAMTMKKEPEPMVEPEKPAPAATEQAARTPAEPDLTPAGLAA